MADLSLQHPRIASAIRLFSAWTEHRQVFRGGTGVTVAIVADQQLLWCQGFGYANIECEEPASPNTVYRVASITKLFTATAIMQLRDAGKLNLYDPISQHIPWFNMTEAFPDAPPITIQNLLSHTAGLPREPRFDHWLSSQFPEWAAIKARLPEQETVFPRYRKWKYSNLALALAREIVASASGRDYFDYVEAEILAPLGMSDSQIRTVPVENSQLATGYSRRDRDGERLLTPHTDAQGLAAKRQANAEYLRSRIESDQVPTVKPEYEHVWHQFTVRINGGRDRDAAVEMLKENGVGTGVFYPVPAHQHDYMHEHIGDVTLPVTEKLSKEVFSLPVHPQLSQADLEKIVTEVTKL